MQELNVWSAIVSLIVLLCETSSEDVGRVKRGHQMYSVTPFLGGGGQSLSHISQAGLELNLEFLIFLHPPPEDWNYRCALPHFIWF